MVAQRPSLETDHAAARADTDLRDDRAALARGRGGGTAIRVIDHRESPAADLGTMAPPPPFPRPPPRPPPPPRLPPVRPRGGPVPPAAVDAPVTPDDSRSLP